VIVLPAHKCTPVYPAASSRSVLSDLLASNLGEIPTKVLVDRLD
jgi:hypothetical protein